MEPIPHMSEVLRLEGGVALKALDPALSARPAMRARWEAASPRLQRFSHPAMTAVLAHGEDGGRLTVTVEWAEDAEDLRTRLRRDGPMTAAATARILEPAAGAIDALDVAGLTYADAKTGNVLRDAGGRVRLAHAWLSFPGDDPRPERFLDPESFAATIDYAAPEVAEGGLPTLRSDVYGLACAAFECLAGTPPFARETEDATLEAHLHEPPPGTGDPGIDAALRRALAKDPRERHATASGFVADLAAAAGG